MIPLLSASANTIILSNILKVGGADPPVLNPSLQNLASFYQNIASAALFLAAKVEEQPQKLEYVARVFYSCINRDHPNIDPSSEVSYLAMFNVFMVKT